MYKTMGKPGHIGNKRDQVKEELNQKYGVDNWRIMWKWGEQVIPRDMAIQLYERAYYEFFQSYPVELEWLVNNASDVYDLSKKDVESGLDYSIQQSRATHLQDIAIRRSVLLLGRSFEGDKLLNIRHANSLGSRYSPGEIPFHMPEKIIKPSLVSWWDQDSIEDFYQSNKILQVRS